MTEQPTTARHRILARQMRRSGVDESQAPDLESFQRFLALISGTYTETEQAQKLNDRALELASKEMQELYDNMEGLVRVRTQEIEQAQTELIAINEQLQAQSQELEQQHEDIHRTNVELELKTEALDIEKARLEERNSELAVAMEALKVRAEQLSQMSQYKSAFLASMSHELRTPLNSLLILADVLTRNEEGNLTDDQIESVETIHGAGVDLLNLINQILDLAKIESGGMTLEVSPVRVSALIDSVESIIAPIARDKGLRLQVDLSACGDLSLTTDATKAGQILKNLLSNACKFTPEGAVSVVVAEANADDVRSMAPALRLGVPHIMIQVADSGIGIDEAMQETIFEAFKQGDSGTSRRFGGTGLGLAISRELARLLGGDIHLASAIGKGSTFTLILPMVYERSTVVAAGDGEGGSSLDLPSSTLNGRGGAPVGQPEDAADGDAPRHLLIVEDDARFADIVRREAEALGFETLVATDGIGALKLAADNNLVGMTLDLRLPDLSGWQVLAAIQADARGKRFPVLVMSVDDDSTTRTSTDVLKYLTKPVSRSDLQIALRELARKTLPDFAHGPVAKTVLLVVPDVAESALLAHMLKSEGTEVDAVDTGAAALERLERELPTVAVVDVSIQDVDGVRFVESISERFPELKIIGVTEHTPSPLDAKTLSNATVVTVQKGPRVYDRLTDEVSLILHSMERASNQSRVAGQPNQRQQDPLGQAQGALNGSTVLVVDDDRRNVFALKKVLHQQGCFVLEARDGREAVETVFTTDGVDAVLMDIMMPEMDGYEAIQLIREQERFASLPIIALTALAMAEDREKCLTAGANDYVSKPIDATRLLSLLSLWLQK